MQSRGSHLTRRARLPLNQAHVVIVEDEPLARRRLRRLTGVAGKRTTHKKIYPNLPKTSQPIYSSTSAIKRTA